MGGIYSRESRVYWADTDAARIAHFSSIFRFCEATEEEFIVSLTGGWKPGRVIFPRVHASCDFKAPLRVHDRYRVDITDIVLGDTSITWHYKLYNLDLGREAAECRIVTVTLDPDTFQPVPIPGELRRLLLEAGAREKNKPPK